ncbi:immunoglobulin-like domain-containing protein [Castellaniella ginsengisoli]
MLVTEDMAAAQPQPADNAVTPPADPIADQVLAALDAGQDPFAILDPTAAVLTGGGGGGAAFTRLSSVIETTTPLGLAYPRPGVETPEFVQLGGVAGGGDGDAGTAAELRPGIITLSSPDEVIEGDKITVTATVSAPVGGSDLVITLNNGEKITIPVGQTTGSVDIESRADDPYLQGDETSGFSVDGVTGGDFTSLDTSSKSFTVVVDDHDPTTVAVTADPATEADANVTFHFALSNKPQGAASLVVTINGTDHTVTLDADGKGSVSVPNANTEDPYNDASDLVATVKSITGGNFEDTSGVVGATGTAHIADTVTPTTVAVTADPATEADANVTFHFALSNKPQGAASLVVTINGTDHTVTLDADGKGSVSVPNANTEDPYNDASDLVATVKSITGGNFEDTSGVVGATGTAHIADTVTPTTVAVTADPATEADANVTFHFALSNKPQGAASLVVTINGTDHTVTLDADGKGSVSVPNANTEDPYNDASDLVATVKSITGGNFEDTSGVVGATGTAHIADTVTPTTVAVTADPATEADANVTFHFALSNKPQGAASLVVTINGTDHTVTLDADGKGSVSVPNANTEDPYNDASDLVATVKSITGGNFEDTSGVAGATGTAHIADTVTPTTVAVTADPATEADANVTFHFALSNKPQGAASLVVTINGTDHTVTLDADGKGSVSVPNANTEDPYNDASDLVATVKSITGGNFEDTSGVAGATGTAHIADTVTPTTVAVTADPATEADANVTFHFALSNKPQGAASLVVTINGTDHTVTLDADGKGSVSVPNANTEDPYNDASDLVATVKSITGGNFEDTSGVVGATGTAHIADTVTPTTVAVTADPATEADANVTFHFALSNKPQGAASLVVTINGTDHTVTLDADGKGSVSVPNANTEDPYNDASDLVATVKSITGGNFEDTSGVAGATGTAHIADTVTPTTVAVTADPATEADANVTFHFALSNKPQGAASLVVTINGTDHTVTLDADGKGSVSVPNANTEDPYNDASDLVATVKSITGGNFEDTSGVAGATGTAHIADTVTPTTVAVTADPATEADANVTFHFALSNKPQGAASLVVTINGTDHTVTLDADGKGSVSVPNANTEDPYNDASDLVATVKSITGGNFEDTSGVVGATGTAHIADTVTPTTVAVTADPATEADANVTFHFALSNKPQGAASLVVTINGTDHTVTLDADGKGSVSVPNANTEDPYNDASDLVATVKSITGGNFEDTSGVVGATGTAHIADTVTPTTVAVTADPATEADANVTFHFALSNKPQGAASLVVTINGTDHTVTLDADGKGSVSVPNTNTEDPYNDASDLVATVKSITGGNFEDTSGVVGATGTAHIADTVTPTTVAVTADPATEADANVTFHFALSNKPQGAASLVVTINGTDHTVTLDADGKGSVSVPNANTEDPYNDASDLVATVKSITGGNFEDTSGVVGATGTAHIADTVTPTTVAVTADPATEADANVTFHFALSNKPQGAASLVVTINGTDHTVTLDADGKGSVSVPNANTEDPYNDASDLVATVKSITGGNFEDTSGVVGATGTAHIADTVTPTTVAVTADPATEADANVTFHFALSNKPQGAASLVVTINGTDHTVTLDADGKGSVSVPNTNTEDPYNDASDLVATVKSITGGNFEDTSGVVGATGTAHIADTVTPTTVAVTADPATEADANVTFHFALSNKPQGAASLVVTINGTDHTVTLDADGKGSVSVPNANTEDPYNDASDLVATVKSITGGNFEDTSGVVGATGTAHIADTVTPTTVAVTADPATEADANVTFHFALSNKPQGAASLVVTINGTDHTVTLDADGKGSVSVPNANTEDPYNDASDLVATVKSITGGNFEDTSGVVGATGTAHIADTVTPTTVAVTADPATEADANVTFHFALSNKPQGAASLVVTINGTDHTVTLDADGKGSVSVPNANTEDPYNDASDLVATVKSITGGNFEDTSGVVGATGTATIADTIDATSASITTIVTHTAKITVDNVNTTDSFTVTPYNTKGREGELSTVKGTDHDGFGVKGTTSGSGDSDELGYGSNGTSERIVVEFNNEVKTFDVQFAWRNDRESAKVEFYDGETYVGSAIISGGGNSQATVRYYDAEGHLTNTVRAPGGSDEVDLAYTFEPGDGQVFDKAVFSAVGNDDDYLIHSITYKEVISTDTTSIPAGSELLVEIQTNHVPDPSTFDPDNPPVAKVLIGGVPYDVALDMNGRGTQAVNSVGGGDISIEVTDVINANFEEFTPAAKVLYQDSLFVGDNESQTLSSSGGNDVLIGDATNIVQTGSSYQTIAAFSNGGSSGINGKNGWDRSGFGNKGGSVSVVNNSGTNDDYLELSDKRDTAGFFDPQYVSIFKSALITGIEQGQTIRFNYETKDYENTGWGDNDSVFWYLVNSNGDLVGSKHELSPVSDFTSQESDPLSAGSYRLVFEVFDDSNNGDTLKLRIDDIQIGTHTEIDDSVGNDTLLGGAGDDILFGDVLNTDNLPWSGRPDSLPDGSGLDALRAFLKADSGHEPTDQEILDYIKGNIDLLSAPDHAAGGNDTLIGGAGSDTLIGGEGYDTFVWKLADLETDINSGLVPTDTIKDFGVGNTYGIGGDTDKSHQDVLDLSDLLSGHTSGEDLSPYLNISGDGHQTTIEVKIDADGNSTGTATQQIVIENVDLTSGHDVSDQTALINSLISDGKLKVDQG